MTMLRTTNVETEDRLGDGVLPAAFRRGAILAAAFAVALPTFVLACGPLPLALFPACSVAVVGVLAGAFAIPFVLLERRAKANPILVFWSLPLAQVALCLTTFQGVYAWGRLVKSNDLDWGTGLFRAFASYCSACSPWHDGGPWAFGVPLVLVASAAAAFPVLPTSTARVLDFPLGVQFVVAAATSVPFTICGMGQPA